MNKQTEAALDLIGRVLLAAIFVIAAIGKINNYAGTQGYMQAYGVPGALLPLVIACELLGGIAVIIGLFTRVAAGALALFSLAAIVIFHHTVTDETSQIILLAELGFTGGLIMLVVNGPGAWSVDCWRKAKG